MSGQPSRPPIGPSGRADLLWMIATRDPAAAAGAAALLGFDRIAERPLSGRSAAIVNDRVQAVEAVAPVELANSPRAPLQCPVLWQVQPASASAAVQPAAVAMPATAFLSEPELDRQLKYRGQFAPLPAPLWPELHHVLKLQDSLARPKLSRQVDWVATATKLARQQTLAPLPRRLGIWQAPHAVVLLDTRDPLRVLEDDWRGLLGKLLQRRGGLGLEAWRLPHGPSGPWHALGGDVQRRPWSANTAVLVVSDLGDQNPGWNECWENSVLRWRALGVHLSLLFPGGQADMPAGSRLFDERLAWTEHPSDTATDDDLQRLLEALSLAVHIDPALLRVCRRAVAPRAGAILESRLWQSPSLVRLSLSRRWQAAQRDRFAAALDDERRWPTPAVEELASLIQATHAHLPQNLQDQETLNLAAVLGARGRHPAAGRWRLQAQQAQARQTALVGHLLRGVEVSPLAGPLHARAGRLEAEFAQAGLDALSPQARAAQAPLASQWFAVANWPAARSGQRVPDQAGVDRGVLSHLLQSTGALPRVERSLQVRQQGQAIWLHVDSPEGVVWPAGSKLGEVRTMLNEIEVRVDGRPQRYSLAQEAIHNLCLARWTDRMPARVEILWGTGPSDRMDLQPGPRPNWASGWGNLQNGVRTWLDSPLGERFSLSVGPDQLPVQGERLIGRMTQFAGMDPWGPFVELRQFQRVLQRFRYIEPGSFLMGSPAGRGEADERPQHPVTITQGYWLADTPCTQAFWAAVMDGDNPSEFKRDSHGEDAGQRPVEQVSWHDVVGRRGQRGFLDRLKALLPEGCYPALPTEAEWEYVARAGSTTAYPWGDTFDPQRANTDAVGLNRTTPVKQFNAPNAWGLHDMHGNVWEWCADGAYRKYLDQPEVDPAGPKDSAHRAVRGGSWGDAAGGARSACRRVGNPSVGSRIQGFRLALMSPGPEGPGLWGGPAARPTARGGPAPKAEPQGPLASMGQAPAPKPIPAPRPHTQEGPR